MIYWSVNNQKIGQAFCTALTYLTNEYKAKMMDFFKELLLIQKPFSSKVAEDDRYSFKSSDSADEVDSPHKLRITKHKNKKDKAKEKKPDDKKEKKKRKPVSVC
jgi:hypothetical protein